MASLRVQQEVDEFVKTYPIKGRSICMLTPTAKDQDREWDKMVRNAIEEERGVTCCK